MRPFSASNAYKKKRKSSFGNSRKYGIGKSVSYLQDMSSNKSAIIHNETASQLGMSQNSFMLKNELSAKSKVTSLKN